MHILNPPPQQFQPFSSVAGNVFERNGLSDSRGGALSPMRVVPYLLPIWLKREVIAGAYAKVGVMREHYLAKAVTFEDVEGRECSELTVRSPQKNAIIQSWPTRIQTKNLKQQSTARSREKWRNLLSQSPLGQRNLGCSTFFLSAEASGQD